MPTAKRVARLKKKQTLGKRLEKFLSDEENGTIRAQRLIEEIYDLAIHGKSEATQLAAAKIILERIDGKVPERKEIKSVKVEGIVHIPRLEDSPIIPILSAEMKQIETVPLVIN